jgi:BolA protein
MGRSFLSDKELTGEKNCVGRESRMRVALNAAFSPEQLDITDDSDRHAGHAGAQPGGETHYTVRMRAKAFSGLSRVERQRAVNRVLAEEFATGLHALSLDLSPGE